MKDLEKTKTELRLYILENFLPMDWRSLEEHMKSILQITGLLGSEIDYPEDEWKAPELSESEKEEMDFLEEDKRRSEADDMKTDLEELAKDNYHDR